MIKCNHKPKWLWIAVICSLFLIGIVTMVCADVIPPANLTKTRMKVIERRVFIFIRRRHRLPEELTELPTIVNYDNSIVDAWSVPIIYSHDKSGRVTLTSLGADRRLGGSGSAADIEYTFFTPVGFRADLN
jgi:hypothetical protein